jgi:hypothetical protein
MTAADQGTYAENLMAELDGIAAAYADILAASVIENVDPNRWAGDFVFIGFAEWDWADSDDAMEAARMALLRRVRDWAPRFRLLFPHPTPTVRERLDDTIGHLERWLLRDDNRHDIPPTIREAQEKLTATVADLRGLTELLPPDDYLKRLVVDTIWWIEVGVSRRNFRRSAGLLAVRP